jgi:hypothetical protein
MNDREHPRFPQEPAGEGQEWRVTIDVRPFAGYSIAEARYAKSGDLLARIEAPSAAGAFEGAAVAAGDVLRRRELGAQLRVAAGG